MQYPISRLSSLTLVVALSLTPFAQGLASSLDNSADRAVQNEQKFQNQKRAMTQQVTLEKLHADMVEAQARAAKAQRQKEGKDRNANGMGTPGSLASMSPAALRAKMGLPPAGATRPSPKPAKKPKPIVPPAPITKPTLMSVSGNVGLFKVNDTVVRAKQGQSIDAHFKVTKIKRDYAVVQGPKGTSRLTIAWEHAQAWNHEVSRKVPRRMAGAKRMPTIKH